MRSGSSSYGLPQHRHFGILGLDRFRCFFVKIRPSKEAFQTDGWGRGITFVFCFRCSLGPLWPSFVLLSSFVCARFCILKLQPSSRPGTYKALLPAIASGSPCQHRTDRVFSFRKFLFMHTCVFSGKLLARTDT